MLTVNSSLSSKVGLERRLRSRQKARAKILRIKSIKSDVNCTVDRHKALAKPRRWRQCSGSTRQANAGNFRRRPQRIAIGQMPTPIHTSAKGRSKDTTPSSHETYVP